MSTLRTFGWHLDLALLCQNDDGKVYSAHLITSRTKSIHTYIPRTLMYGKGRPHKHTHICIYRNIYIAGNRRYQKTQKCKTADDISHDERACRFACVISYCVYGIYGVYGVRCTVCTSTHEVHLSIKRRFFVIFRDQICGLGLR